MSFYGYRTVYSGDEGRLSPDRPTTKSKRYSRASNSPRKRRYSRDSVSPRSDQFSDNESTSPITIPSSYKSSSSDSEDEGRPHAGAKFNSPPPAYLLPIPPPNWISASHQLEQVSLSAMSSHLRQILKVSV
jgi:hypothetical protein